MYKAARYSTSSVVPHETEAATFLPLSIAVPVLGAIITRLSVSLSFPKLLSIY